jgi:hypothetical protein
MKFKTNNHRIFQTKIAVGQLRENNIPIFYLEKNKRKRRKRRKGRKRS